MCEGLQMQQPQSPPSPATAIAVIEDDDSLRNALVGLLRSISKSARGYVSAEAFLAEIDESFVCVVTDIQLPGMTGIELAHRLGKTGNKIPVIVITAQDDKKWAAEAKAAGVLCLLRKPFETHELLDCLERALAA